MTDSPPQNGDGVELREALSPRKAPRTHRNSLSTSVVPELLLRANATDRSGRELSGDEDESWSLAGPYAQETHSLREDAKTTPKLSFGTGATAQARFLYGAFGVTLPSTEVRVTRKRWLMLAYLSLLALLSDWICFSAAPIAPLVARNFKVHDAHLVTCFLATNVVFCLLEPSVVRAAGLRAAVVGGAVAMALGCLLRCLAGELAVGYRQDRIYTPAYLVVAGTMLVGAAQPFFQCTPSLLAANWFGESETTLAATVALNSNQLGIALAYAVGAGLVRTDRDLLMYGRGLFAFSFLLALGCALHFRSLPRRAPSASQLLALRRASDLEERRRCIASLRRAEVGQRELDASTLSLVAPEGRPLTRWLVKGHQVGHGALDLGQKMVRELRALVRSAGVRGCVVAFVCSIATSNLVSAFLPHLVYEGEAAAEEGGFVRRQARAAQAARVAVLGSAFQLCILAGSLGFGAYVDASKRYKAATGAAFLGTVLALGVVTVGRTARRSLDLAVLLLGCFVGPVQPLAAELAVEVTYPDGDENTIVALMQTVGNLCSAAAVPAFLALQKLADARGWDATLRFEYLVLGVANLLGAAFFALRVRRAPLKRAAVNNKPKPEPRHPLLPGLVAPPTPPRAFSDPDVEGSPHSSRGYAGSLDSSAHGRREFLEAMTTPKDSLLAAAAANSAGKKRRWWPRAPSLSDFSFGWSRAPAPAGPPNASPPPQPRALKHQSAPWSWPRKK